MQVGVMMFVTDQSVRVERLATAIEERNLHALVLPERTHLPVSRTRLFPGGPPIPAEHGRTLDPFVALAAAATVTTRLLLATGICLVAQHHPIALAKTVASLDVQSRGRFLFGIGFGWHPAELANHGLEVATRRAVAREKVLAMKALWTRDEADFVGEHVSFSRSRAWPKPVQRPHPPVLIGAGPSAFADIVAYADGWMPHAGFHHDIAGGMVSLRQLAEDRGRDPSSLSLTVLGVRATAESIEAWADLGVERAVFDLPSAPTDETLRRLDSCAAAATAAAGVVDVKER